MSYGEPDIDLIKKYWSDIDGFGNRLPRGDKTIMTAPKFTPPTVGQPPVAEREHLTEPEKHLRELSDDELVGDFSFHSTGGDMTYAEACREEIIRRLAQARSAPPSEGIVLVSREAAKRILAGWGPLMSEGWSEFDDQIDEMLESALAAPSGGPDVE